jgi:hypothetical protein
LIFRYTRCPRHAAVPALRINAASSYGVEYTLSR